MVSDAAQHSEKGAGIEVVVAGDCANVQISVENPTDPIPAEVLNTLFEPMKRHARRHGGAIGNLAQCLFIVRKIARARRGEVHG